MVGSPAFGPEPVGAVLSRRGLAIETKGKTRDILLPLDRSPALPGEKINEFTRLFAHSSFRRLVRNITTGGHNATLSELRKIAGRQADEYARFLAALGVAEVSDDQVTLTRKIDNIGPTLEWYVADVCKRNFEGSAEWSVRLAFSHGYSN
jgi:hypothetical protein